MSKLNLYRVLGEVVLWSAFLASGGHVYQVASAMGNPWFIAAVHAIGLDGLVYVGINAMRQGAKALGALGVVYGGGMSLAFNAASYSESGELPAWVIAASMPVALILSVIVSHAAVKSPAKEDKPVSRKAPVRVPATAPPVPSDVPAIETVSRPEPPVVPVVSQDERVTKALAMIDEGREKTDVAATVGCSVRTLNRWIAAR